MQPEETNTFDSDTAAAEAVETTTGAEAVEAVEEEDFDPTTIGAPGDGNTEYDIEYKHPKTSGVITVFAHDPETAKAALKIKIEEKYGAGDDLEILSCDTSE